MFCASLKFGGSDHPAQHLVRVYGMLSGLALPLPSHKCISRTCMAVPALLSRTRMTLPPTHTPMVHIQHPPLSITVQLSIPKVTYVGDLPSLLSCTYPTIHSYLYQVRFCLSFIYLSIPHMV